MYEADRNFREAEGLPSFRVCQQCGCLVHYTLTLTHEITLHPPYDGE